MVAFHELVLDYFYGTKHLTCEMKAAACGACAPCCSRGLLWLRLC